MTQRERDDEDEMMVSMSVAELLALPVSVNLKLAGKAFGIGYTTALDLANAGDFPCRVIRVGKKFRVPRAAILETLGIDDTVFKAAVAALAA